MDPVFTEERLVGGYSGRVLITVSLGYLIINLGVSSISPLLPEIIETFDISPLQAGAALSLVTGAQALSYYPGGRWSDLLTRKTVLVGGAAVVFLGFGLLAMALSYPVLLLACAAIGLGGGLYWISLRALLADLFTARRAQAFGLQDALGSAGPLGAAVVAILAVRLGQWNVAYVPLVLLLAGFVFLVHRLLREEYVVRRVELDVVETTRRIFAHRPSRRLFIAYSAVVFTYTSVIGFVPTFLQAERAASPTVSSLGYALVFVGAMGTMPIAGFLGDRFSYRPVAVGGLALALVGLITLVMGDGVTLAFIGIVTFAFGAFAFPPVVQAHLMTLFPTGSMGGDYGMFKAAYTLIGSLGPVYVGAVASAFTYAAAFTGLMALVTLAIGIIALGRSDT